MFLTGPWTFGGNPRIFPRRCSAGGSPHYDVTLALCDWHARPPPQGLPTADPPQEALPVARCVGPLLSSGLLAGLPLPALLFRALG